MRSKQGGRTCILPQRFSKNYEIGTQDKRCYLYGIKQVGTKDQLHSSLSKKMETLKLSTFPQLLQRKILKSLVWESGRSQATHNHFIENIDRATDTFVNYLNTTRFTYSLLGFSCKT